MKRNFCIALIGAVVLLYAPLIATAQTTIYQHEFNGLATAELGGTTTDLGDGTWANVNGDNSSSFRADGTVVTGSAASGIWLPVTIEAGNVYILSADVDQTAGNWISLGYASHQKNTQFTASGGYGTVIVNAGSVRPFAGRGSKGAGEFNKASGHATQHLSIVLDATDADTANWRMLFFENGVSLEGRVAAASGDYGDIGFIGFTTANGDSTGSVDNLKLIVLSESGPQG